MTLKLSSRPVCIGPLGPAVARFRIRELASIRWIANANNVLLLRPGVGKTKLAVALERTDPG
ncbi:ATP-binding protein [Bradyrhizobium hipponense]|uniref:ATP-binding protein n=1 Tax=Bradyrhizobium hipponense TaxID=2605638 RepID=UPI001F38E304|nr:ATP-binding protein [Bradyrhizobium hipponense]